MARLKYWLLVVLLGPVLGTLIHEAAHVLMLVLTGSTIHQVVILGRLQLVPEVALIESVGAGFMLNTTNPTDFAKGLVWVTGASATFLVSLAVIPYWLKTRSKVALIFVCYAIDLFTYLTMPLFGLKRWILFGAPFSEVLYGLELLGVGRGPVAVFLLAFAGGAAALILHAKKTKAAVASAQGSISTT